LTTPFDLTLAIETKDVMLSAMQRLAGFRNSVQMARAGGCRNYRGLAPRDELEAEDPHGSVENVQNMTFLVDER
jgi:hypothetical protein